MYFLKFQSTFLYFLTSLVETNDYPQKFRQKVKEKIIQRKNYRKNYKTKNLWRVVVLRKLVFIIRFSYWEKFKKENYYDQKL